MKRSRLLLTIAALFASALLVAGELDRCDPVPEAIEKIAPDYPLIESPYPQEGYAIVEFTITKEGSVEDAVVVEAVAESGNDSFEYGFSRSAKTAISGWRYEPRSDACRAEVKFTFAFDDE